MRRGALAVMTGLALGVLAACGPSDSGPDIVVSPATEAKARFLAAIPGPVGWTPQDNAVRALNMKRYELGGVPLVIDTSGGVSVGFVSDELDEPATYRTGCDAVAEYLGRVQTAVAADTGGAAVTFSVDDCVTGLTTTTTDDGGAIGDTQSVPLWSSGAKATGGDEYLLGLLRLGGAGENPRTLNVIVGWRPTTA